LLDFKSAEECARLARAHDEALLEIDRIVNESESGGVPRLLMAIAFFAAVLGGLAFAVLVSR
jgi:hypothetical protein